MTAATLPDALRRTLCALMLGLCLMAAGAAAAQAPAPARQDAPADGSLKPEELSRQELRDLIATLQDDEARAKLVARLQVLARAGAEDAEEKKKKETPATASGIGSRLLTQLSERIEGVSEDLVAGARIAVDLPRLWSWGADQLAQPDKRAQWFRMLWKAALVILAGLLADWLVQRLLRRMRAAMGTREAAAIWVRIPIVLARGALDLLPVAAFLGVAYALLAALEPARSVRDVTLVLIEAIVVARLVTVAARLVLTPRAGGLRPVPLGDEDANYAFIWVRRLTVVGVYGYYGAEAARAVGLPAPGVAALQHFVGLIFLLMTVVFVLQNRHAVAAWLRGGDGVALRVVRARFADVWHVLAILYLVALYLVWVLAVEDGFRFLITATLLSLLILVATRIAIIGLRRGAERLFSLHDEVREQHPGLQARTNRYLPIVERSGILVIDVVAAFAVLEAWGIDSFAWLATPLGQRVTSSTLAIAGFVIGALVIWEGASAAIERYLARQADDAGAGRLGTRARTLLPLFRTALMALLITVVALVALSELGVNIAPLLAGAGVIGLAIGFGAQTLVKDIITGIFILLEDQIAVGDVVRVGTHAGLVEKLTLRTIRLRDLAGNVHLVPFSEVSTVENMTKDFSRYVFDVGVAYREDTDKVVELLQRIGAEMQEDEAFRDSIVEPLEVLGVDSFGDSAVVIKARITTRPIHQWKVGREFNRRMKKLFDEEGIEIPFPHRTLYFGALKDGTAPPAFVELDDRRAPADAAGAADDAAPPELPPPSATPDPGKDG